MVRKRADQNWPFRKISLVVVRNKRSESRVQNESDGWCGKCEKGVITHQEGAVLMLHSIMF